MNNDDIRQRIQAPDSDVSLILVVEDDWDNLLLISHVLILLEYNFITAFNGREALELATKYEIDLVLLDLLLPDLSGFELIEYLKHNRVTQDVPVIVVSGLVSPEQRDRAFAAGCNDYLEKPYLIEDLHQKIRLYLPQSSSSQTARQVDRGLKHCLWLMAKLLGIYFPGLIGGIGSRSKEAW